MSATGRHVLIVDDDEDFLAMSAHALAAAGFAVAVAASPAEALARLSEATPDVIVSDLMMDSLDAGFSFARTLKADRRFAHVPILLVTSMSSAKGYDFTPRSAAELRAMNVESFLEKPVRPTTLVEAVKALAGGNR